MSEASVPKAAEEPEESTTSTAAAAGVEKRKNTSWLASEPPARELTTKEAYFQALNAWVKNANISQNAMSMFPWYMLSNYPQMFQNPAAAMGFGMSPLGMAADTTFPSTLSANAATATPAAAAVGGLGMHRAVPRQAHAGMLRVLDEQTQAEIIQRNGGFEYTIAPFWKRAIAEAIDVVILLVLKVVVTFTLMNIFDFDLGFDMDKDVLAKAFNEDDYSSFLNMSMDFLAFSSDLLLLEFITKAVVCLYEALWTTLYNGSTPGKAIMNLRIQYCEAVLLLQQPQPAGPQPPPLAFHIQRQPMRALVYPAQVPGFIRAFIRAAIKNIIVTLLFPMCFIMAFFKHNRTAYDIITKTVVVENNPNAILRFQR